MRYKYTISFPNGTKTFEGSDRLELCSLIESDELNICNNCGYKILTLNSLFSKIGKYNPKTYSENGCRVYEIDATNCRECARRGAQSKALKEWYSRGIPEYLKEIRSQTMTRINKDFELQAKIKRDWALKNLSDYEILHLYVAKTDLEDFFKIGITYDTGVRQKWSNASKYYNNIEVIKSGKAEDIINLEYDIKLKFCNRDFEFGNEYFSSDLIESVKEFAKA